MNNETLATVPEIQPEAIQARLVHYTNRWGTEVTQQRFYAVSEVNGDHKWRQLKNKDVREMYAENFAALTSGNVSEPQAAAAPVQAPEIVAPVQSSTRPEARPRQVAAAAAVGNVAVGKRSLRERMNDAWGNKTFRRIAIAGSLAVGSILGISTTHRSGNWNGNEMTALAPSGSTPSTELVDNSSNTTSSTPNTTSTTAPANQESGSALSASEKSALDNAINQKLSAIGLQPNQYTEVTDPNAVLPQTLTAEDANTYSIDGGTFVWLNYPFTVKGGEQLSQDELNAKNGFSAGRAAVAKDSMAHLGVPADVINSLTNGDYSKVDFKVYTLNGTRAVYHNMTENINDQLQIEQNRLVSNLDHDAIVILSWMDANGNPQSASFRWDCGPLMQGFETVTVETPSTPNTTTTTVPNTTTTTRPTTTTTTRPTTTTTRPTTTTTTQPTTTTTSMPTTTTTGPTTTTLPSSTTTTAPVPPKGNPHPPVSGGPTTTIPIGEQHPGGSTPTTSTTEAPTTSTTIRGTSSTSTTAPAGGYNNTGNH